MKCDDWLLLMRDRGKEGKAGGGGGGGGGGKARGRTTGSDENREEEGRKPETQEIPQHYLRTRTHQRANPSSSASSSASPT